MKSRTLAFIAAAAVTTVLVIATVHDRSAQDAADHATQHSPIATCKAVR